MVTSCGNGYRLWKCVQFVQICAGCGNGYRLLDCVQVVAMGASLGVGTGGGNGYMFG